MSRRIGQPALKEQNADDLLAEFARAGGEAAFGEVVRRYAAMVFAVCVKVTGNAHDAEDATQATFLNLAVQLKSGKTVHRLGPWLQQVARRAALDVRRSRKRRETHEQRHGERKAQEVESILREQGRNGHHPPISSNGNGHLAGAHLPGAGDIDLEKLNSVLAEELGRLPPKYRLPLMSLYFGRMEREEIAKELGLTVGTLGVRIHRGRQMLARRLGERGVAPAGRLLSGNVLAVAISTVARANLCEQTAAAAAKYALGHDLAATTAAHVLAAIKGTALATALAKVKTVAVVAVFTLITAAVTAAAGAAVRWESVEPHLPDAVRRAIDWARSPWYVPQPRPWGPLPSLRVGAEPPKAVDDRPIVAVKTSSPGRELSGMTVPRPDTPPPEMPAAAPGAAKRSAVPAPAGGPAPPAGDQPAQPPRHLAAPPPRGPLAAAVAVHPARTPTVPVTRPPAAAGAPAAAAPSRSAPVREFQPGVTEVIGRVPQLALGGTAAHRSQRVPRGALVVEGPPPPGPGAPPGPPPVDVGPGGSLHFGGDQHGGTVVQPYAFNSPRHATFALRAGNDQHGAGTADGWGGAIGNGNALLNDGRVVADGHGQDRALIFSGYNAVQNSVDNPTRNGTSGWFARNGGRLILPKIPVAPGTGTYTWGEDAADPTIDLVNSVRVTLHDVKSPGKLDMSLLDKSRADVPTLPAGHTFIGVWSFDVGTTRPAGVDLTVRYDDRLASSLGLNESALKLWRYDGDEWVRITDNFSRDIANNLLSGRADELTLFAVSAPEPSAMCVLLLGGVTLLRRPRRQTRKN